MSYTMKDFRRDCVKERLKDLTPQERVKGLSIEELIEGIPLKEVFEWLMENLSPSDIEDLRKSLSHS